MQILSRAVALSATIVLAFSSSTSRTRSESSTKGKAKVQQICNEIRETGASIELVRGISGTPPEEDLIECSIFPVGEARADDRINSLIAQEALSAGRRLRAAGCWSVVKISKFIGP